MYRANGTSFRGLDLFLIQYKTESIIKGGEKIINDSKVFVLCGISRTAIASEKIVAIRQTATKSLIL